MNAIKLMNFYSFNQTKNKGEVMSIKKIGILSGSILKINYLNKNKGEVMSFKKTGILYGSFMKIYLLLN